MSHTTTIPDGWRVRYWDVYRDGEKVGIAATLEHIRFGTTFTGKGSTEDEARADAIDNAIEWERQNS